MKCCSVDNGQNFKNSNSAFDREHSSQIALFEKAFGCCHIPVCLVVCVWYCKDTRRCGFQTSLACITAWARTCLDQGASQQDHVLMPYSRYYTSSFTCTCGQAKPYASWCETREERLHKTSADSFRKGGEHSLSHTGTF